MTRRRRSAGFTLVELLVAMVIFSVVATLLTRMLITSQRVTTTQAVRASLQSNLRVGSLVVPNELRMLNQSSETDIVDVSDSSITYRAMRGYYVLCAVPTSATSITVVQVQPSPFSFDYRTPQAGDSAFVHFENDTLKISDDVWVPVGLSAVSSATTCTYASSSRAARTFTLSGTGIVTATYPWAKFQSGAPVRTFEITRMSTMTSNGQKYLGMCTGGTSCTLQPVLGPLASTNGFVITRFNDVGTAVTGNTNANRNSLRYLRIQFIGVGEASVSKGTDVGALSTIQDTLTTTVTLRNVKQN